MKRFMSFLFVSIASMALFIACGDDDACLTQDDCDEGFICNTEEGVCEEIPSNILNNENNLNNLNNENNLNNLNNENNLNNVETGHQLLLIEDTSSGADACDVADPGSDIYGVALVDETGVEKAWGVIEVDNIITDGNDFTSTAVLSTGAAPALDASQCPEGGFEFDTVLALGCGGSIVVEFQDASGVPVQALNGDDVVIYEYGPGACNGTDADRLSAALCTDVMAVKNDANLSSCTLSLVSGADGITNNTVSF